MAALAWAAWQLTTLLRTWRRTVIAVPLLAEPLATHRFRTASALGTATTGTLLLWRSLGAAGTEGRAIPTAHLLDALDHFLVYLGFALLLLSLLALFPPGAGLAVAGAAVTGEGALGAAGGGGSNGGGGGAGPGANSPARGSP
ncbi:hypothetical protein OG866_15725 [Streptomyces sp. NBC_00663]|uniref:hypothetical protein n=1 Tax=Streptomyces sp. NBC_00663 TaxID=2975801 RepID=UPI002E353318|nr:hypothetical protein [Streptomyces sp. NBC_00663]